MAQRPPRLYGAKRSLPSSSSRSFFSLLKRVTQIRNVLKKKIISLLYKKKKPVSSPSPSSPQRLSFKKKGKKSHPIRRFFIRLFLGFFVWGACGGLLALLWFSYDLPDINHLQATSRKPGVVIQGKEGRILNTYGDLWDELVKVSQLPPYVPQAFMAIEDRRFFQHFGVDFMGLIRAAYTNYKAGRVVQGGSTLTQQLAKNFLFTQGMYGVSDRSLRRKIQEAILAVWLEWRFTKDQIFTMYLNRVYFGSGTYGIEAAARKYFNKSARHLTLYEAAMIAGLLKAPSRYSPNNSPKKSKARAKVVLIQMSEAGYIPDWKPYWPKEETPSSEEGSHFQGERFFADWIYETIPSLIGAYNQDLIVKTTFDHEIQQAAEQAARETMERRAKDLKVSEVALLAMTPDGGVCAMVGGMNYFKSQYNRSTQALRQPGSAFKPFVYLAGLESGLTPDSLFSDDPIQVGKWSPKNFRTYRPVGELTLQEALTRSVNTVTVRIALQTGAEKIAEVARRLGITSDMIPDMSIALGTTEVTLLELVAAYATFINQGRGVWPYGIVEIRTRQGDVLYTRPKEISDQVIKPSHVRQMNKMLINVVRHGTGRRAQPQPPKGVKNLTLEVGGKTGSNGDRDAWFVGYTSQIAIGVWAGNDNNAPMKKNSTGSQIPADIFSGTLSRLLYGKEGPLKEAVPDLLESLWEEDKGDSGIEESEENAKENGEINREDGDSSQESNTPAEENDANNSASSPSEATPLDSLIEGLED